MKILIQKPTLLAALLGGAMIFTSCEDEPTQQDPNNTVEAPLKYEFNRNGESTVAYSGQSVRLQMGGELSSSMLDFSKSETELQEMYANEDAAGNNVDPWSSAELNNSDKSLRSKTAASYDLFNDNATLSAQIRADFEGFISKQVADIFPAQNQAASQGVAGQIADGSSVRYVDGNGFEYNQFFSKSLIGALMTDQMLNNYLSPGVLDAGSNRADNDNEITVDGKPYTNMEHKWDEAYGYLFGLAANGADPLATLGADDAFLNKYLGRVDGDPDFAGIAQEIFDAFKLGRAAIVAGNYELRDEQAAIIQEKVSTLIAVRSIYYLKNGKTALENNEMGTAFHDLSEAYGFVYSLMFTHNPETGAPYFTEQEVSGMLAALTGEGSAGFWTISSATLDQMSNQIAGRFGFSVAAAL